MEEEMNTRAYTGEVVLTLTSFTSMDKEEEVPETDKTVTPTVNVDS